jgi:hypothetical protein
MCTWTNRKNHTTANHQLTCPSDLLNLALKLRRLLNSPKRYQNRCKLVLLLRDCRSSNYELVLHSHAGSHTLPGNANRLAKSESPHRGNWQNRKPHLHTAFMLDWKKTIMHSWQSVINSNTLQNRQKQMKLKMCTWTNRTNHTTANHQLTCPSDLLNLALKLRRLRN